MLQMKYEPNDEARAGTDEQDFDGWAKMDTHEYHFATVNSKEDLEVVLRNAQLAILNPTTNPAIFADLSAHEAETRQRQAQFSFSPNIISLEITGTELPELSLFDLPGAINATAIDDDQYLVEFIEALLTAYIRDEKAKILLACAANQDIETSTAFRYLRNYRALKRCMGVLTKPDLFESGAAKTRQLEKMLQGDASTFKLGLGWYATKQLSQTEVETGITYNEARQRETNFFASTPPWSHQLVAYTARFGIPNLQKALSQLLTADIIQSLPEILDRVKSRLADVDRELAKFPEQAAAPSLSVMTEIDVLKTAIIKEINPNSAESSLRSEYQQAFRNLSDTLLANKPTVELKTPGYTKNSITLDDSEDEDMDDTPSKRIKTNGGRAVDSTPSLATPSRPTPSSARMLNTNGSGRRRTVPDQASISGRHRIEFKLEEIKARYDNAPGADMPGTTSEHVDRKLKLEPLDCWNLIVEQTLTQIKRLFTRVLKRTVEHALATRKGTELYLQAITLTRELFEELHDKQTGFAYQLVAAHVHRPITYSKGIWRRAVSAVENGLRTKRLEQRVDEHFDTLESQGYKVPSKPDQRRKAADPAWVTSTLGVDEYEREVKALASPIAYYEHAAAQLVDVLARMCEQGLMGQYESRIHRHLFEGLGATDQDHCARLLAEDPAREEQRHKLKAEKAKLEQALADLEELPVIHG